MNTAQVIETSVTVNKFSPFVWETWMILTRKRLLVDIVTLSEDDYRRDYGDELPV